MEAKRMQTRATEEEKQGKLIGAVSSVIFN